MAPFFQAYGLVKNTCIVPEALATVTMRVTKLIANRHLALLPAWLFLRIAEPTLVAAGFLCISQKSHTG